MSDCYAQAATLVVMGTSARLLYVTAGKKKKKNF